MRYAESRTTKNFPFWTWIARRTDAATELWWARKCILSLEALLWHHSVTVRSVRRASWVESSRITEFPNPQPLFLSSRMTTFSSNLNCLNRVVVKVYRLPVANWESTVTVSVVPKLDKLGKLCIYSIVAEQGKNNKSLQFHISRVFNAAKLSPWQLYVRWITKFSSLESVIHSDIYQ